MILHSPQNAENSLYSYVRAPLRRAQLDTDCAPLSEVMTLLGYEGRGSSAQSDITFRRRRVRAGQSVFAMGQEFNGLYVVRLGALKSVITHTDGSEHVTSFAMKGDLLGSDGVCDRHYWCESVALTDCEVIRLPEDGIFSSGRSNDDLERMLYWATSREVSREQSAYAVSHATRSEVRVARFLIAQSESFAAIGCSTRHFTLPMTRRDIGSYLCVTLETVSRALSALHQRGIIEVVGRDITIFSMDALRSYEG